MDVIFHYYYTVPKKTNDSDDEDAPGPIRDIKTKGNVSIKSDGKKSVGFGDSRPIEKSIRSGTAKES